MSVVISGALIDGAGIPMSGCHIILKSRVNTSEVVVRTVADVVTGNCGEYCFKAQTGKYCVYLKQDWRDEYCVGDIAVYDDSKPGTLNDFLTAPDEGDLKPDVVKRFEEMVAQAQQSAEAASESERQTGQHAADVAQSKKRVEMLAGEVQQNASAVAASKQQVEQLASEVERNAGQVQQGVQSVTDAVKLARQAAKDSASSAEDSKTDADNAAQSERNAKSRADNAAGNAQQTAQDVATTETARNDAERFANEAENSALVSGTARDESVDAAERARQHKEAASSAATSSEQSANTALVHKNNAAEYARQAKVSQDASAGNAQEAEQHRDEAQRIVDDLKGSNASTTEKGLVQLCSDTDNDSEELAATPKAVKTVMDETKTKAPLNSPAFTGTPTTPTPPDDAVGLEAANAAFVRKLLAALVDSSPEALDTLNELAAALGNDPNFATTIMNALSGKQPLSEILTSLSGLKTEENGLPYFSGRDVMSLSKLTDVGRTLIGLNTEDEVINYLGITGKGYLLFRGNIPQNTNIDTSGPAEDTVGVWVSNTNTGATIANGYPENDCQGILEIFNGGPYGGLQRFTTGTGCIYTRSLRGKWNGSGPWSDWKSVGFQPVKTLFDGDLNNLTGPGIYSSTAQSLNVPLETKGAPCPGVVRVTCRASSKSVIQQYTSMSATPGVRNRVFHRTLSGNTWSQWSEEINSDTVSRVVTDTISAQVNGYPGDPGIGGLVLAAYQGGTDGDKTIKVVRGQTYPGSRLGAVSIECGFNSGGTFASPPQFYISGCLAHALPGSYIALSGAPDTYSDNAFLALFVRVL